MKNRKYMFIMAMILIVLIILVSVQSCVIWKLKYEKITNTENIDNETEKVENENKITYTATEDSKRFKEEYEALNGTTREKDGETYNTVNIPENNPIIYVSIEEFVNIINSDEEAYIYMSNADCPYCRATIGTLLEVLQDLGVEKLYYLDLASSLTYKDEDQKQELTNQLISKELVTKKEDGSESWRIPLVAKTRSGEVLSKIVGSNVAYNEEQTKYSELTEEQKQVLYNRYYETLKD